VFGILGDRYDLVGIKALKIVLFIKHNPFSDICVGIPQSVDVRTVLDVRCDYDVARCAIAQRNLLRKSAYRNYWTCRKCTLQLNFRLQTSVYTQLIPSHTQVIVIPDENSLDSFGLKFVKVPLCE